MLNSNNGVANGRDAKLDVALGALADVNDMNDQAAANSLMAFINEVQAQAGNGLTE